LVVGLTASHHVPEYRAYIIGQDGHFYRAVNLDCADDADASEAAKKLADGNSVELWQRDRMLRSSSTRQKAKSSPTRRFRSSRRPLTGFIESFEFMSRDIVDAIVEGDRDGFAWNGQTYDSLSKVAFDKAVPVVNQVLTYW
jgi:hypothetical protein